MQMIIMPYVGVGSIKFGMTREEVRNLFPEPPKVLENKKSLDGIPIDFFALPKTIRCIQCEYRAPGILKHVDLAPESKPTFRGRSIFDLSYKELVNWLKIIDANYQKDEDMLFPNLGLAVGEPVYPEKEPSTFIGVFERGCL